MKNRGLFFLLITYEGFDVRQYRVKKIVFGINLVLTNYHTNDEHFHEYLQEIRGMCSFATKEEEKSAKRSNRIKLDIDHR